MVCLLTSAFLTLLTFSSASSQADVLLSYPQETDPKLYEALTGFDNNGNLWMIGKWQTLGWHVVIIDPKGNEVRYKSPESINPGMYYCSPMLFDSWGNPFFAMVGPGEPGDRVHLIRVTPQGEWRDYYPWPGMISRGSIFLGFVGKDTLMLVGPDSDNYQNHYRLSKAVVDSTGITPILDVARHYRFMPYYLRQSDYAQTLLESKRNWGISAILSLPEHGGDTLDITEVDLTLQTEDAYHTIRKNYLWRDFVWRTYTDVWIGNLTFAPYKDEGYVLCIPDPLDSSSTHILRLDRYGVPLRPDTLIGGGSFASRSFDRLKLKFQRYADFQWWLDLSASEYTVESGRVVFWGCDDEGNLYSFQKTKRY